MKVTTPHGSSRELLGAEHHALSSQSGLEDVERGIVVAITHLTTAFTAILAQRQGHHLSMSAVVASLSGVGRGHFDHLSPSFFRFDDKCSAKCAPGRVCDRFVESALAACPVGQILPSRLVTFGFGPLHHVAHDQGLDGDQPEAIDQVP